MCSSSHASTVLLGNGTHFPMNTCTAGQGDRLATFYGRYSSAHDAVCIWDAIHCCCPTGSNHALPAADAAREAYTGVPPLTCCCPQSEWCPLRNLPLWQRLDGRCWHGGAEL